MPFSCKVCVTMLPVGRKLLRWAASGDSPSPLTLGDLASCLVHAAAQQTV